jgi:hypothetical protein
MVGERRHHSRIAFGEPIAAGGGGNVNAQLAQRMSQLIAGPPLDWTPLSRETSKSLTETAA